MSKRKPKHFNELSEEEQASIRMAVAIGLPMQWYSFTEKKWKDEYDQKDALYSINYDFPIRVRPA